MADRGQIMRFKLDSNEILLYNSLNWTLMKPTHALTFSEIANILHSALASVQTFIVLVAKYGDQCLLKLARPECTLFGCMS